MLLPQCRRGAWLIVLLTGCGSSLHPRGLSSDAGPDASVRVAVCAPSAGDSPTCIDSSASAPDAAAADASAGDAESTSIGDALADDPDVTTTPAVDADLDVASEGSTPGCSLTWSRVPGSPSGNAISGSGARDIWILTPIIPDAQLPTFQLARGDGSVWNPIAFTGAGSTCFSDSALWVGAGNDAWVTACPTGGLDNHGIERHWDGAMWTAFGPGDNRGIGSFWGLSGDDVWGTDTGGAGYLGHWNGQGWSHIDSGHVGYIGGGAPSDFWIAGGTELRHREPSGTEIVFEFAAAFGLDASASCGPPPQVPSSWDARSCFHAVWASATDDVWVAAEQGKMFHYDGSAWAVMTTPSNETLRAVSGTSSSDVWAAGDKGTLVHFDGKQWSSVSIATSQDLLGIYSSGPCDAWAIGDAIYHGVGSPSGGE
jgi:hypothetical protein